MKNINNYDLIFLSTSFLYIIILIVSLFFSPLFLFILSFLGLLVFSQLFNVFIFRYFFIFLTVVSLLLIIGSRNYYAELSADLMIYTHVLNFLSSDPLHAIYYFGDGFEVGWSLVYWVLNQVIDMTPIQQSLVNIILSLIIIIFWIELKIRPLVSRGELGIFYFLFFLFVNASVLGFLQRQGLTLGILLFALTSKGSLRFFLLIFLSSVFHLSSILVGLILFICRKINLTKSKILKIFAFALLLRFLFTFMISYLVSIFSSFSVVLHKLNYFTDFDFRISTLRYTILFACLLFVMFFIKNIPANIKPIYNFAILSSIFIVTFAGVPLFADRIFMISMVIYGVFYYLFFYINNRLFAIVFAFIYFIVIALERFNVIGGLAVGDFYWARYDYIGDYIFYYLDRI